MKFVIVSSIFSESALKLVATSSSGLCNFPSSQSGMNLQLSQMQAVSVGRLSLDIAIVKNKLGDLDVSLIFALVLSFLIKIFFKYEKESYV